MRPAYLLPSLFAVFILASSSAVALKINFRDKQLRKFIAQHCQELASDAPNSDVQLCAELNAKNEENVEIVLRCPMCLDSLTADKIATTVCGHTNHVSCLMNWRIRQIENRVPGTGDNVCHTCKMPDAPVDIRRDSVTKYFLAFLEARGGFEAEESTGPDMTNAQQSALQMLKGPAMSDDARYGGYVLITTPAPAPSKLTAAASRDEVQLPKLLESVFDAASEALRRCAANEMPTGDARNYDEAFAELLQDAAYMGFEDIAPAGWLFQDGFPDTQPRKHFADYETDIKSWTLRYEEAMRRRLRVQIRRYPMERAKWERKLIRLKRIVHTIPCDGAISKNLVTFGFDSAVTDAWRKLHPSPTTRAIARMIRGKARTSHAAAAAAAIAASENKNAVHETVETFLTQGLEAYNSWVTDAFGSHYDQAYEFDYVKIFDRIKSALERTDGRLGLTSDIRDSFVRDYHPPWTMRTFRILDAFFNAVVESLRADLAARTNDEVLADVEGWIVRVTAFRELVLSVRSPVTDFYQDVVLEETVENYERFGVLYQELDKQLRGLLPLEKYSTYRPNA